MTVLGAQFNYFDKLEKIELPPDFSYIRKDDIIYFPDHIDNIINYNYVMYQNTNYSHKWFYAFITKMKYVNDGCTAIYIMTDVWQTWQFNLTWKQCFVEREMCSKNDDLPRS